MQEEETCHFQEEDRVVVPLTLPAIVIGDGKVYGQRLLIPSSLSLIGKPTADSEAEKR